MGGLDQHHNYDFIQFLSITVNKIKGHTIAAANYQSRLLHLLSLE